MVIIYSLISQVKQASIEQQIYYRPWVMLRETKKTASTLLSLRVYEQNTIQFNNRILYILVQIAVETQSWSSNPK